jgi:hypothetical protein
MTALAPALAQVRQIRIEPTATFPAIALREPMGSEVTAHASHTQADLTSDLRILPALAIQL